MPIQINQQSRCPLTEGQLKKLVAAALPSKKWEISLAFVGPKTIQKFNRIYRHKDQSTDVLSFKYAPNHGEIIICPSYVRFQPAAISRMLIHGALHLQGYDHRTKAQEDKMRAQEDKILSHVKL